MGFIDLFSYEFLFFIDFCLETMNESSTTKAELDKYQIEYERLRAENSELRETIAQQVLE